MSKSRDALGIVLAGLRELLRTGAIAPGAVLSISDLASRYRVSVTPVREALSRLAGEGVLRATRRLGYERTHLLADDLRQLYAFRGTLLLGAVRLTGRRLTGDEPIRRAAAAAAVDPLFEWLIGAAENAPLARAYAATAVLLAPAMAAERSLFDDLGSESAALLQSFLEHPDAGWEESLRAFHARRLEAAVRLAELLRTAASSPT